MQLLVGVPVFIQGWCILPIVQRPQFVDKVANQASKCGLTNWYDVLAYR